MLRGYIGMLSKTLQRYENKSKSQHVDYNKIDILSCLRLCKDTKIKANHNKDTVSFDNYKVV